MINNVLFLPIEEEINKGSIVQILAEVENKYSIPFHTVINIIDETHEVVVQEVKLVGLSMEGKCIRSVDLESLMKILLKNLFQHRTVVITYSNPKGMTQKLLHHLRKSVNRQSGTLLYSSLILKLEEINSQLEGNPFRLFNTVSGTTIETPSSKLKIIPIGNRVYAKKGKKIKEVNSMPKFLQFISDESQENNKELTTNYIIGDIKITHEMTLEGSKYTAVKIEAPIDGAESSDGMETTLLEENKEEHVDHRYLLNHTLARYILKGINTPKSEELIKELDRLMGSKPTIEEVKGFMSDLTKYALHGEENPDFDGVKMSPSEQVEGSNEGNDSNGNNETSTEVTIEDIIEAYSKDSTNKILADYIKCNNVTIQNLKDVLRPATFNQIINLEMFKNIADVDKVVSTLECYPIKKRLVSWIASQF